MSPSILEIQIVSSGIPYIYSSSYGFYPFLGRRKVSKFAQWSGKTHIFMISCLRQVVCKGSTTIFQINSGTSTFHWHIEPSSDCGLLHRKKSLLCQEEKIPSPKGSYCWNGFRWPSPGVASKMELVHNKSSVVAFYLWFLERMVHAQFFIPFFHYFLSLFYVDKRYVPCNKTHIYMCGFITSTFVSGVLSGHKCTKTERVYWCVINGYVHVNRDTESMLIFPLKGLKCNTLSVKSRL